MGPPQNSGDPPADVKIQNLRINNILYWRGRHTYWSLRLKFYLVYCRVPNTEQQTA